MEKKTQVRNFDRKLAPVRLYLEDVEQIVAWLSALPGTEDIRIETDGYVYANVAEMGQGDEEESRSLSIVREGADPCRYSPKVIIREYGLNTVEVQGDGRSPEDIGTCHRIAELLQKRGRFVRSRWARGFLTAAIVLLWLAVVYLTRGIVALVLDYGIAILGIIAIANILPLPWFPWSAPSVVALRKRKDCAPSFWQRNRDKIAVEVIKALVTVVVGFILGTFLGPMLLNWLGWKP